MKKIKLSDIVPVGNFKELLEKFRQDADEAIAKANEEKKFNSGLAKLIKIYIGELGIIDALETGIITDTGWNIDEMKICLLYTHLVVIDLNNTAHKYLNGITLDPNIKQLQEYIDQKPKVFGKVKLME